MKFIGRIGSVPLGILIWCVILLAGMATVWLVTKLIMRSRHPALVASASHLRSPLMGLIPILLAQIFHALLPLGPRIWAIVDHTLGILLIISTAWLLVALFDSWRDYLIETHPANVEDNLKARKLHTQLRILHHIVVILVSVFAGSAILMTFPAVRVLGATLFASAGAVGLILGLSARPLIANMIAGIQIALTEPFRLDDVVIINGEWGWIEDIRSTYVVVRIWDLRRLIVPLSYFLENPFQNWTHTQANLLGHLYLYADYTLPVPALREELLRVLHETPLWDGKSAGLQVTDATPTGIQIRALMSARNSSDSWNLRCLVREHLITFLQTHYPHALPQTRITWLPQANPPGTVTPSIGDAPASRPST